MWRSSCHLKVPARRNCRDLCSPRQRRKHHCRNSSVGNDQWCPYQQRNVDLRTRWRRNHHYPRSTVNLRRTHNRCAGRTIWSGRHESEWDLHQNCRQRVMFWFLWQRWQCEHHNRIVDGSIRRPDRQWQQQQRPRRKYHCHGYRADPTVRNNSGRNAGWHLQSNDWNGPRRGERWRNSPENQLRHDSKRRSAICKQSRAWRGRERDGRRHEQSG